MCELHLSILKYIGVHGFVDLPNRKCDLGRFPLDGVLGPPEKILFFLPHTPQKFRPLYHHPLEFTVTLHGGGYGYFLEPHNPQLLLSFSFCYLKEQCLLENVLSGCLLPAVMSVDVWCFMAR